MPRRYPQPKEYIQRAVYILAEKDTANSLYTDKRKTLGDFLQKKKKVTLLGVAGLGKSIELKQLAYEMSNDASENSPILTSLNNVTTQAIEEIVKIEAPDFDSMRKDKTVLLLDGLDEVHVKFIDIVSNNINLFAQKYPDIRIIVSCRNNFYNTEFEKSKSKLSGFVTLGLRPLGWFSIHAYLESKTGDDPSVLIDHLKRKNIFDLFSSPFYLVNITKYYIEKGELPNSIKEVFEFLIRLRFEEDSVKYQRSGINIEEHFFAVNEILEEIAALMQYTGRNYLEGDDVFGRLIKNETHREIIKHTFLFNKSNTNGNWEFEHNNFREFLAARFISRLPLWKIKQLISVGGRRKRIMPAWLNTSSMLVSVLPKDKLGKVTSWIERIEIDALVRFEKDKLDLNTRESLFKDIYMRYMNKGVLIRNEKFTVEDLISMVSESKQALNFLINLVEGTEEHVKILESVNAFKHFERTVDFKNRLEEVLFAKINNPEISDYLKFECLEALSDLRIFSDELTRELLEIVKPQLEGSQYLRAGIYKYLINAPDVDPHLPIILKGVRQIRRLRLLSVPGEPNKETYFSEQKYRLRELMKLLTSENSAKGIFEWASIQDLDYDDDFFIEFVGSTLDRSMKFSSGNKQKLINPLIKLLVHLSRNVRGELNEKFQRFFSVFDDQSEIFEEIKTCLSEDKNAKSNFFHASAIVCNEEGVKYFLEKLQSNELALEDVFRVRNYLRSYGSSLMHDQFYNAIIEIDSKYEYPPTVGYEELRRAKKERDRVLMFDEHELLREVKLVFESEGVEEFTGDQVYDFRRKSFNDDTMTNAIVVDILRDFTRDESSVVTYDDIETFVNDDKRWNWYRIERIYNTDIHDEDYEFSKNEESFLREWIEKELPNSNFKTALKKNGKNYTIRYLEQGLVYFCIRLDYFDENYALDLLHVDTELFINSKVGPENEVKPILANRVLALLGMDKVKGRILQNIVERSVCDSVLLNHYAFCGCHAIEEAKEYIFNEMVGKEFEYYEKMKLVNYYLQCNGSVTDFRPIMNELADEVNLEIIEKTMETSFQDAADLCEKHISNSEDKDNQLRFIQLLIRCDERRGFKSIVKWILANEIFPERWYKFEKLEPEDLDDLLFLYEDALIKKYGRSSWSGMGRNECLNGIIPLGATNKKLYSLTKRKIESWLDLEDEEKFLHYQLQSLDLEYYTKSSRSMTFEEAFDAIFVNQQRYKLLIFWEKHKTPIAIVLAVITVIGFLLTLINL